MKSIARMSAGALAVRFYESVVGPYPIEIGAAVSAASLSLIVHPNGAPAAAQPLSEEELGISLLEAEAIGLSPQKVCRQLNDFFAGGRVSCVSALEVDAINGLFRACGMEPEFHISLGSPREHVRPRLAAASPCPEALAHALFVQGRLAEAFRF